MHVPDLYEGRTFSDLDDGVAHARQIGFDTVLQRGLRAADDLPDELVYAGFSLGVMPAREIAATVDEAELFLYPGDAHLFTDSSLPSYDAAATALVLERVLAFLARL